MRSLLVLTGLFLLIQGISYSQEFEYNDSWGQAGYTLESQDNNKVTVNYSIENFALTPMQINGEEMLNVELPGQMLWNDEGAPNLPGSGRYIAVPQGAQAVLRIVDARTETISNVSIAPSPRIPWETEDDPLEYNKDLNIYNVNKAYPAEPIKISDPDQIRGVDVVMLGITPFQYNPVTKELTVYRDIKVEITFNGGSGHFGEDRLRSRWWDVLLSDILLNHESMPKMNYNHSFQATDDMGCEYLIISPTGADYLQWADSIKVFRTLQGIKTDIVTVDEIGGNNANTIETYIDDAYANWDIVPSVIMLLGDYGTNAANSVIAPIYDNYCVSDNIYGDINNNHMPDIMTARMTAANATQLETMVTKFIDYERNPPTNPDFYNNPMTCLGYQTERWFQICTESVAGFWENELGKTTTRVNAIYNGNPNSGTWSTATNTSTVLNFFGPNGLDYIPASPAQVNSNWNGGGSDVVNAINGGSFMLLHRDHGSETLWGEPDFSNSNVNSLNNVNTELTYIWSVNCLTGKYNYSGECLVEKLHRHKYSGSNSGALGAIGDSEVSYSFVNDTYVWGAFDNMWPDFMPNYGSNPAERGIMPAFANAAGKYFLQQSNWPYNTNNKEVTYYLFHHHGDGFLSVYSELPQDLTVSHNPILYAGVTSFDVTANEGALISLTVNGEIIATAEGTGTPLSIDIPGQTPPDQVLVTITMQNYFRYTSLVEVIPPTGPYVVGESFTIGDNTGNNNGMMDYGEANMLSLTVENVGVQQADNVEVTISTTDMYVTITDDSENYGNIAAGATAVVSDGFAYDVANDIPDGHTAVFDVSATDGSQTWESTFTIMGHAPVLEFADIEISDPTGNGNNKLDPGETADVMVYIENTGSSEAYNIMGELMENDPYLTINSSSVDFGDLIGGNSGSGTFSVTAAANTPAGHLVDLMFEMNADMEISGSGAFDVVIGQIPILIVDMDGNQNSASEMENALVNMDVSYESAGSLPPDLNLYSTIFVFLGVYSNNYILSNSEGQALADFLNNGGALYMEGGDTWYYDTQTPVHAMFNINGTNDGSGDLSAQVGQAGTFTESMSFNYSGDNEWIDRIEAISPAVEIFQNQSPAYGTGVANDAGTYKTIGVSHEFGGLVDGASPSTKEELMQKYMEFLGIDISLQAVFNSNITEVCEEGEVEFFDQSSGDVVSWSWTFEGGTPATSTDENPVVMYATEGTYDVTLEVSDGTETASMMLEDYVTVITEPAQAAMPQGDAEVCTNVVTSSEYTTAGAANADSYMWMIFPEDAGSISGSGMNATVEWTADWEGTATLTVMAENDCGTGEISESFEIMCSVCTGISEELLNSSIAIYPNPTTGDVNISLNTRLENIEVSVFNVLNETIINNDEISNQESVQLDLSDQPAGLYFVRIKSGTTEIIKKIVLR
ncbi:MAG: T9SS type A sorting domain-containing protein [Bacteroidales bacterium]|nr:T9SS type A sorting domain-containing protein [Bacteroidales bacterium]